MDGEDQNAAMKSSPCCRGPSCSSGLGAALETSPCRPPKTSSWKHTAVSFFPLPLSLPVLGCVGASRWEGPSSLGASIGGSPVVALLMPLLSLLQINSSSAGKEVLTSIFSATAETLSTSTTTHVTKVRAAPKRAAGGFLMQATGIGGWVDLYCG